jgi:uncharacterized protein
MRRFYLLFCALMALAAGVHAQKKAPSEFELDSAFIRDNFNKREVMIPMRDGAKLFTAIYTPKNTKEKYPILLNRTPYSCAPYGEKNYKQAFANMFLARAGYIFVYQDVRGRYMSEGDFMDVRPFNPDKKGKNDIDEASDTYDTAEWLVKNLSESNGNIGVYGVSYPGFYSTMASLSGHPAIKAVSPQAPVTDWFIGDDFHHNGAFFLMDAFSFYSGFGKARPTPTTKGNPGFSDYKTPDNYDFYLRVGALQNFNRRFLKDSVAFWNELMQHPNYDDWWKARNPRPHLRDLKPAMLTVGGLFDAEDCWGAWNTYKSIENQSRAEASNRIVMGPWAHGAWARSKGDFLGNINFGAPTAVYYQQNIEMPFFEFYLKGKGKMDIAEANVFETGSNRWTTYDAWPPKNAEPRKIFFREKGGLSFDAPKDPLTAFDEYLSDPSKPVPYTEDVHLRRTREYMLDDQRFAARRPDVLTYETEVLSEDITVAGPLQAEIWFSTSSTDADIVVKLIDVLPDTLRGRTNGIPMGGYQMLVRGEVFRGRYRNSFEKPEAFLPHAPSLVRYELPDVAHTFKKGHRIMIQVQSSWFPLVDRNPQQFVNIYHARDEDFISAQHRVWHTPALPSGVVLPVIKR